MLIFEKIGEGIVLLFKRGLPYGWHFLITKRQWVSRTFIIVFLIMLSYVAIIDAINQLNPLIFLQAIGNFFLMIDKEVYDAVMVILNAGTFSFYNIFVLLGSVFVYYKIIRFIFSGWMKVIGEGSSWLIAVPLTIGFIWIVQVFYVLLSLKVFNSLTEMYIPFASFKVLFYDLLFKSNIIQDKARELMNYVF